MQKRLLLCRPQGGLNDILCQIEKCCRYAEVTNRYLVVDSAYLNSDYFRDDLDRYFTSKQKRLILSSSDLYIDIEAMQVYPEFLHGRINCYEANFVRSFKAFCDTETGKPITFDFRRDYPYPLLVHHQAGGGVLSQFALLRLSLNQSLIAELKSRIDIIGGPWVGVHIRNTDYKTDYESLLIKLKNKPVKRIFLATDSHQVREKFRSELVNTAIHSFSKRLSLDETPLQKVRDLDYSELFSSNVDAIIDLLMLALSSKLLFEKINPNIERTSYSGYAILAHNLWTNKILLRHIISDTRIEFGLR